MRINRLLIAGIVSIGLLTSCASNNEEPSTSQAGQVKLTLTLSSATTRTGGGSTFASSGNAATTTPSGDGTLKGSSGDEAKLNRICVGIFKSGGATLSIQEVDLSGTAVDNTQTTTYPNGVITTSITTTTEAKDIVVAANVPTNMFNGIIDEPTFLAKAADLASTTSADASSTAKSTTLNSQTVTALPMYGINTISPLAGTPNVSTNIPLTRMVARIGIQSIRTVFDQKSFSAGVKFIPTEVFIYNANTSCNWDGSIAATPTVYSAEATTPTGTFTPSATVPTPVNTTTLPATGHEYLSSGKLDFSSITPNITTPTPVTINTQTYSAYETDYLTSTNQLFFYVFPNNATASTKLVIKGTWFYNNTYEVVYYPIVINHAQLGTTFNTPPGTNDSKVLPNTRYTLSATIMGKGSSSPGMNIDPVNVALNVTVYQWNDVTQDVVNN